MKYGAILVLVAVSVVGTLLTGCNQTPTPPVDKAEDLEKLVEIGDTLEYVQSLMTDYLTQRTLIYPAASAEKKENGAWSLKAKEGGRFGDTDAPYVIMLVSPTRSGGTYYTIFFHDSTAFAIEKLPNQYIYTINQTLGGQIESQLSQ